MGADVIVGPMGFLKKRPQPSDERLLVTANLALDAEGADWWIDLDLHNWYPR